MAGKYSLGKNERIHGRKLMEELFSRGIRLNQGPFRVVIMDTSETVLKLGVGAPARNFKRSVDRNRIKRLLREAFRLNKGSLKEAVEKRGKGLLVFISFSAKELPVFTDVEKGVKSILHKLVKRISENPPVHT